MTQLTNGQYVIESYEEYLKVCQKMPNRKFAVCGKYLVKGIDKLPDEYYKNQK